MMRNKWKKMYRIGAYVAAACMLAFYLFMLIQARNPQVTADYRMRYIESGYFVNSAHQ